MHWLLIGLYLFLITKKLQCLAQELYEDDPCTNQDGSSGICTPQPNCAVASKMLDDLGYHTYTHCGYNRYHELLCCPTSTKKTLKTAPAKTTTGVESGLCTNDDGSSGICRQQPDCALASKMIDDQGYHTYTRCGFEGDIELLCCPSSPDSGQNGGKSAKACDSYYKTSSINPSYLISGGKDAELGEFPHMAALAYYIPYEKSYSFDCGGTLISDRFVLTAAHCIRNNADLKFVRMGEINVPKTTPRLNSSIDYEVETIYKHPSYESKQNLHDLALLKLLRRVQFTELRKPACLYTKTAIPSEFKIVGWGYKNNDQQRSNILQKANVDHVALSDCKARFLRTYKHDVQDYQICASNGRKNTCRGDSGGPLQVIESNVPEIIGVTSYGADGCGSPFPTIYTNVQKHLAWIEDIVWKDSFL